MRHVGALRRDIREGHIARRACPTADELHGHVFSERFQKRAVDNDDSVERSHGDVLADPVRAGLCDSIEDRPETHSRYIPALRRF